MNVTLGTYTTTPAIRSAVNAVLDSGRLSYGPVTREYERRFAEMHGCAYGVASNSGTSSLVVAIQALKEMHDWQDGDEVICPALTFVATINAVLHNRLTPVLVDVEPQTYNIDADLIADAITPRTRAILPVHLFGQPANMGRVFDIANLFGLSVIEDSCEAMRATHRGFPVGAWGDVACFSTYSAHLLVTGVGGIAITSNPDLAQIMRSLVNHGIDLSELPTGAKYDPTWLARKFRFNRIGHSFRITEIEAAIGLAQLDALPAYIAQRQWNAAYLTERLQPLDDIGILTLPKTADHNIHSWMVYPIVLVADSKWPVMEHLQAHGIECREMMPLTNQPAYQFDESAYPVAAHCNRCGFYVGIHQDLTPTHLDHVVDTLEGYFDATH
jgi:dTDP-4-amino-4,6-dideoxygalactose transaminase